MPKRVGIYLRVSTAEQTVENQRLDLVRVAEQRGWAIVEEYVDHGISGAKGRDKRPAFDRLCKHAIAGKLDIVAAWSIDRLGRSVLDLAHFVKDMEAAKVDLLTLKQGFDTSTASGRLFFSIFAAIAEFEREIIRERINAGIARARAQGRRIGRPPVSAVIERHIRELRGKGFGKLRIARELHCGVRTVGRVLASA